MNIQKNIAIFSAVVAMMLSLATPSIVNADVTPSFRTGNIVTAINNTTSSPEGDTVQADPGNVVEYRMVIQNMTPGSVAKDVLVGILWPQTPSNDLVITMEASANGVKVSDTANVHVNNTKTTHLLDYYKGHSRVFSPGCPNGCSVDDTSFLHGEPINIGDLAYGESAQVMFKASVNRPVEPTPNPTVTPTPAASATPAVVGTTTTTTTTLPKTGLPLAGLALSGLLPFGAGLKRFSRKDSVTEAANSVWEKRQLKK